MNLCKGCTAYMHKGVNLLDQGCAVDLEPQISETQQCPCVNCLIKVMCSSICDEFRNYIHLCRFMSKREANGK